MEWHKAEDYPVGSDEYVLVSSKWNNKRFVIDCFVAKKHGDCWLSNKNDREYYIDPTDRWCHVNLLED